MRHIKILLIPVKCRAQSKKLNGRFVCHHFEFFRERRPVTLVARNDSRSGIGQKAEGNVEEDYGASVALLLRLFSDVLDVLHDILAAL